jgi:predicted dehydrogenase
VWVPATLAKRLAACHDGEVHEPFVILEVPPMHALNRRQFLKTTAGAAAAGYFVCTAAAQESQSPNERLNIAAVGVANKGGHNLAELAGQNIVALCDVDENYLNQAAQRFSQARKYRDYRKMLEAEANRIDAVVVSTADHTHAPAASVALDLGKGVYCEKPLSHTVAEARALARLAAKKKVATQMGTQIHASDNYRRVVELVQSGAIGKVNEVHNWCNKGWSDGRFQVAGTPAPAHLDWDHWLGPAKERPYCENIHPANWRRFWEYGSGTFGDMACHVMDLPFWALGLRHPVSVACEGPPVHPDGAPSWTKATYEFPREGASPLLFTWSDGGAHFDLVKQTLDHSGKPLSTWGLGVLFVGERGMLAADYGRRQLLPQEQFRDFKAPEPSIPASIGHWHEWVHACKTGSATTCNFDYSGALTETVLLGIVAFRSGEKLSWDAAQLKARNSSRAEEFVHKSYRKGFEVVGLDV